MRLHHAWTNALVALCVLSGGAYADVTVSRSNDPTSLIGTQFASLLKAEHKTVDAISDAERTAMAVGPKSEPKLPVTKKSARKAEKPAAPKLIEYSAAWLYTQAEPAGDAQWQCLKTALYFESRGETLKGQFAVAEVILNRVDSPAYPKTVCGVVGQSGGGSCQFSYNCDGNRDVMRDAEAADIAGRIARVMLDGAPRGLTTGATHFHTRAVRPNWAKRFPQTAAIGAHLFYRQN